MIGQENNMNECQVDSACLIPWLLLINIGVIINVSPNVTIACVYYFSSIFVDQGNKCDRRQSRYPSHVRVKVIDGVYTDTIITTSIQSCYSKISLKKFTHGIEWIRKWISMVQSLKINSFNIVVCCII